MYSFFRLLNFRSMGYGATVTIVNIEKRQVSSRYFRTISEAMSFLKSYPRYKGCFMYCSRYDEVISAKSDLAPLKLFTRSLDFEYDPSLLYDYKRVYWNSDSSGCPDSLEYQTFTLYG